MVRLVGLCMLCLLWSATALSAQDLSVQTPAVLLQKERISHPAILWPARGEASVKQLIAKDSLYLKVHRAIVDECNRILSQPPVQRVLIGKRLLDKSRTALQRIFFLSYAYRITSDARYLKRAEQEMLAVSAFSDWNPSHFLDVAEMSMGVAIGYDWLFDALPELSKQYIREALYEKGVALALNRSTNSWTRVENNWNQVCNAGMAFGALALYNHYPEACREVIAQAVKTLPLAMA
ncbi:MAG: heparinase, partial [Bacteroidales bacterium]